MKLNFEGLEMQKWNIPTDRAQRADGKNGVICLVSCLLPKLWSLKCQKWLIFCIFCWCQQKISHIWNKIINCTWKILFNSLRKCYGLLDSELPLARYQPLKIRVSLFFADSVVFWYFYFQYLTNDNFKPMNHTIFWKNSKRLFRCTF